MRVLSLCDRTGVMVQPWLDAGFECWIVDRQHPAGVHRDGLLVRVGADVNEWEPPEPPSMTFAFPACTHLAISGARWFRDKGLAALIEGLTLVERCRVLGESSGGPWMLENPVGVLSTYWREPDMRFDPWEFAGWSTPDEAYTKRTCLWFGGGFQPPLRRPLEPTLGSLFHRTPPSEDRGDVRSVTPAGFARAVFEANVAHVSERVA